MVHYFHSLYVDKEKCNGCMACMRVCPTEAIRVRAGKVRLQEDRCIDCGECISICSRGAIIPLTNTFADFSQFKHLVAIPSPALYGHFGRDVHPHRILNGLKQIGFDDTYDLATACESVSLAIEGYLESYRGPRPLISSSCPAIVRLVQVKYPSLIDLVIPIEPPREIAAREMKIEKSRETGLKPEEIGAIYLTPCPAKIVSIRQPAEKERSRFDGAISIKELYRPLLSAIASQRDDGEDSHKFSFIGIGWAIMGSMGMLLKAENWLAVAGLNNVIKIFEDIENGRFGDIEFVECFSCLGGCIGGPLAVENVYVSRSKIIKLLDRYGPEIHQDRTEIRNLLRKNYFFLEGRLLPRPLKPLNSDLSRAIEKAKEKERIYHQLPRINCGACGSPSCMAFADDLVRGDVAMDDCVFKYVEKLESELDHETRGGRTKALPGG